MKLFYTPGASSLPSNNAWSPKQIPRNGTSARIRSMAGGRVSELCGRHECDSESRRSRDQGVIDVDSRGDSAIDHASPALW